MLLPRCGFAVPLARDAREPGPPWCWYSGGIVPQPTNGVVPRFDFRFASGALCVSAVIQAGIGSTRPPPPLMKSPPMTCGQRPAVADERRNRVDHRFGCHSAEGLFPHGRHDEDSRQSEVIGRCRNRRRRHDLRILAEVDPWNRVERAAAASGLHHQDRNVRSTGSQHDSKAREQQRALVPRWIDERHECARLGRRHDRRPIDRRVHRRAHQAHSVAVMIGQEPAARERMINVIEIPRFVVTKTANRKRRRDAAAPRPRHRLEDHRMSVAGDQLRSARIPRAADRAQRDTAPSLPDRHAFHRCGESAAA